MESCIYEGIVHHERMKPLNHRFHYRMYMAFLDLAEVPGLMRAGVLSTSRFAPQSLLRCDHFGDSQQTLEESVRNLVQSQTGAEAEGPIRLLTQLRNFGCYFSPLNLFFCYGLGGQTVEAIVAEVQNTPWLERHCYVLWRGNQEGSGAQGHYRHRKAFHVSPFMDMDMEYRWRLTSPGEQLQVGIETLINENAIFGAAMQLRRAPFSRRMLLAMQFRYPLITAQITAAIYFQAFQLWRKKCPYYQHPKHRPASAMLPGSGAIPVQHSSLAAVETSWPSD